MMPGAFNAATARLVERAGFPAVYVSGAGLANATAGVPDIGLLTLTEVAQLAGYIADAVRILNSWGRGYPHRVWMPDETLQRLIDEDGEVALITDR